jgi:hypothetical protein
MQDLHREQEVYVHIYNACPGLQLNAHYFVTKVLANPAAQAFLLMLANDLNAGIYKVTIYIEPFHGPLHLPQEASFRLFIR